MFSISYDAKMAMNIIVKIMDRSKRQPLLFSDSNSVFPSNNPNHVPIALSIKNIIAQICISVSSFLTDLFCQFPYLIIYCHHFCNICNIYFLVILTLVYVPSWKNALKHCPFLLFIQFSLSCKRL